MFLGLRGIGGDGGMGSEIPALRQGGGFGNFNQMNPQQNTPDCIILDDVPADMHRKELVTYFSKFGSIDKIDYDKARMHCVLFIWMYLKGAKVKKRHLKKINNINGNMP